MSSNKPFQKREYRPSNRRQAATTNCTQVKGGLLHKTRRFAGSKQSHSTPGTWNCPIVSRRHVNISRPDPKEQCDSDPIRDRLIVEVKNVPDHMDDLVNAETNTYRHFNEASDSNRARSRSQSITNENGLSSFAQMARGRQIMGVIDSSHPNGQIPRKHWPWIQASMAAIALDVLRDYPGPLPSCRDIGWFQGITKLIACENERSVQLYRVALARVGEVYPGAQLEVINVEDIPSRPWATAWLPNEAYEAREILELVTASNPNLPTNNWKVIKAIRFKESDMEMIFQINHESISYLNMSNGHLNYGFHTIHMKYYARPCEALSNLEEFAAAVDSPTDDEMDTSGDLPSLSPESDYGGSRSRSLS